MRTAWAGLARVDGGASGAWEIAAVASAQRLRDRERAASRRLIGSVAGAAVLVLAFGGFAMRQQRKELLLERELAVAALQERGDERLQRAGRMAALGTLAIGVAHEICDAARRDRGARRAARSRAPPTSATQRGLGAILDQVKRIDEVIRGLLGLARGDAPAGDQAFAGGGGRRRRRRSSRTASPRQACRSRARWRPSCRPSTATRGSSSTRSSTCCSTPATPAATAAR